MKKDELKKHLHECLRREVMISDKPFSWVRTFHKAFKCPDRRFNFWWRIVSFLYNSDSRLLKKMAHRINRKLIQKYNTEIQPGTQIGPGLKVSHFLSVVINGCTVIGCNFKIRQNSTIGISGRSDNSMAVRIIIGDNVEVGAGSCIIGDSLIIGNNVTIGAMSFINQNIPDNSVVYTEKMQVIRPE
ncbi:serine acetyltransferase [Pantoea sp. S-LA4]|uniref:serine acetyltransferase n=1 Tax=Pantoea TaxID=53335 RepID=UPI001F20CCF4|nr:MULTISPECIES: serine acetyltransferase [Pantoea]UIL53933.1 serine acetyltransferase [Pantoea agglomerans]